jgi:acyl-CoA synthetase (AMP-forming)/AMP-acid ligase II
MPLAAEYRARGLWTEATFARAIEEHARSRPSAEAVVDRGGSRRVTFAELDRLTNQAARFLSSQGCRPGDVLAMQLHNCLEAVVVTIGGLKAGLVLNPLVTQYRAKELAYMLGLTGAPIIFTPTAIKGFAYAGLIDEVRARIGRGLVHVAISFDGAESEADWLAALEAYGGDPVEPARAASDVSVIQFTSGTTSDPKAVMLTEETLCCNVSTVWSELGMDSSDVVWMPSPVGHSTGFNWGIRFPLLHGAKTVLQESWSGRGALELIRHERPSYTLAATTFLADVLEASDRQPDVDLSCVRNFGCGGAAIPPDLVEAAYAKGMVVTRLYGQSETEIATMNRPTTPYDKLISTDGLPLLATAIEIRDDADGVLPAGAEGEVHVRGPGNSVGYLMAPERTRERFRAGWVKTGDIGRLDEDGYLTIVARKSEVIIRGGVNISPREIEDEVSTILGVRAVAVIGVPDGRLGEIVCACIVCDDSTSVTLDQIIDRLAEAGLAKYKLPQRLELFEEFPVTDSGKIQRHVLAERVRSRSAHQLRA